VNKEKEKCASVTSFYLPHHTLRRRNKEERDNKYWHK